MIHPLILLILALAVTRASQVIVDDKISEPIRMAAIRRFGEEGLLTYLVHCLMCVSVWVGMIVAVYAWAVLDLNVWLIGPVGLAFSYLAVVLNRLKGD